MKKVICILIAVVLAGIGYYYWMVRQPSYSLGCVITAIGNKDWTSFQKYVDVDGVSKSIVEQMTEHMTSKSRMSKDEPATAFFSGIMTTFAIPQLKEAIKTNVEAVDGTKTKQFEIDIDKAAKIKDIGNIEKQGKIAIAIVNLQSEIAGDYALKIKLRDMGDYWQVSEILNLGELLDQTVKAKEERKNLMISYLHKTNPKISKMYESISGLYEDVHILENQKQSVEKINQYMIDMGEKHVLPSMHNALKELESVTPPPEIKSFHEKRIKLVNLRISSLTKEIESIKKNPDKKRPNEADPELSRLFKELREQVKKETGLNYRDV